MAWIESHQSLREHPKTKRLCRLLKINRREAVGMLQFLWWWAYDYAPEGDLSPFTDDDIADAIDWDGEPADMMKALIASGFIDDSRILHDWWDYAQKWIERRRANAARMRATRAPDVSDTCESRALHVPSTCLARVEPTTIPNQPDLTNQTGPTDILESPIIENVDVLSAERELFDYYRQHIQPSARTFTASKVKARLKKFSANELKRCVDNFAGHWWWMEHNAHRGADWFFRSDGHIEQFLNMKPEAKPTSAARPLTNGSGRPLKPWEIRERERTEAMREAQRRAAQ